MQKVIGYLDGAGAAAEKAAEDAAPQEKESEWFRRSHSQCMH
jgi:hypothetical protein